MATTYDFLKSAWQQKKLKLQQYDLAPVLITAVLLTIPLPYIVNSIAVILFATYALFTPKKTYRPALTVALLLPILLYGLMAVSVLWSIDTAESVKALSKELSLLVIPLSFLFYTPDPSAKSLVLKNFSYGMAAYAVVYMARAVVRYFITGNADVFFYHELVTKDVNAIYISVLFSVAFFYFLIKSGKKTLEYAALALTLILIILLSSKNIIIIDILIICIYYLFFARLSKALRVSSAILVVGVVIGVGYFSKIKERVAAEFVQTNNETQSVTGINKLTVYEAYTLPHFTQNDYFNGTAFRVYQIRIFKEMLQEDGIVFTGYGLNASLNKIKEKGVEHNVYQGDGSQYGYHMLNFHNQYIEVFADLGVFGFLLLVFIQIFNLKNALKSKDFVHIAFAILMISLFLTESFLWRQRGVVFFTMLYCLYNSAYLKSNTKSTI